MSASREQIIRVVYDATQAIADARKAGDQLKQIDKQVNDATTKSSGDAATARKRAVKDQVDAEKSRASYVKDLNGEVNRILADLSRDDVARTRSAAREKATAEKKEAKDRTDAERAESRKRQEIASIEDKWLRREYKDRVSYQKKLIEEHNKAVEDGANKIMSWGSALAGAVGMGVGISGIVQGVKAIAESWDQIHRETIDSAKELMQYREQVMELAAMRDHLGNSTPEAAQQLTLRGETLQTRQAALSMSASAEGAGQAAIGKNITREAFDEGLVAAGKLQAMEGSDAGAYGSLYGTLALEAKEGTTGAQMKGAMNREYEIQKPGKFVNMAQFAHQREQLSAYVSTGSVSGPEASALLSALSLATSPDQAATMAQQILRSTSADFMRARKMKTLPGDETETSAEYFQKHLGLKKDATAKETWEAAAKDINRQEEIDTKAGKKFSAEKYLEEHGIANAEARRGYAAMAGIHKQKQWQQFQDLIDNPVDSERITKDHAARIGREPVLQKRQADLAAEAKMVKRSMAPEAQLEHVQRASFERLQSENKITGTFEEWQKRGMIGQQWDDVAGHFTGGGTHRQVNMETQRSLVAEAKRLGIDVKVPKTGKANARVDEYMGDKALMDLMQKIQKAGGNPLAAIAKDLKEAVTALKDLAKKTAAPPAAAPAKNMPPAALPGRPPVDPRKAG